MERRPGLFNRLAATMRGDSGGVRQESSAISEFIPGRVPWFWYRQVHAQGSKKMRWQWLGVSVVVTALWACLAFGQEPAPEAAAPPAGDSIPEVIEQKVEEIGSAMNQNQAVREISAGVLDPIYKVAENIGQNQPWFYWVAFAVMAAGVVSFAGQVVFTKFLLLFKGSLNFREILSDLLGLAISVVGLVLTTQAAAENSQFTSTPAKVVSAAAVGVVAGIVFWIWGTSQEFRAARRGPEAKSEADRPRMR
jgi:hypothetical protein